jgi:UDP-glucose 4-epimerase
MKKIKNPLNASDKKKKWFVTGGAGFIGSHVVDTLVEAGCEVTVYDNYSLSSDKYIKQHIKNKKIKFHEKDMLDFVALKKAMKGHDIVWHLGANTDIPSGFKKRDIDMNNSVLATKNVLDAMVDNEIKELLFSSTGAVYGESIKGTFSESSGPLHPLSHYGAGKIACEAFISSYCSLYGIHAWMFRFGNVIGGRMSHGIIFDFINKLKKNPKSLEILGTGKGQKNYFLVEECINGMLYTYHTNKKGPFPFLVNLGTNSTTTIMQIAEIIIEEMGLKDVKYTYTGTPRGWPGDQPIVLLDTTKINSLGWHSQKSSVEAVRTATQRMLQAE